MLPRLAYRAMTEIDGRLLLKFAYTFGFRGMLSVERFKRRLKRDEYFPPFLYVSIINSCNLSCQGCWVDVKGPRRMISAEDMDRLITDSKRLGNRFFGILGGEPLLHPDLLTILGRHRDCYFQVFTNGQLITDEIARTFRRFGNVSPLISIEGSTPVSDVRRGGKDVLNRTLAGLEHCVRHRLITGVATSVCQSNFDDLLSEKWLEDLIRLGVLYAWYYTYRPVGPDAAPELALTPDQVWQVRRFVVEMRHKHPIGIVDAYYDDRGQALCPAATGISHHIGPAGDVEPCPIIQLATETIRDNGSIFAIMKDSRFLADFRRTAAQATRGCIVLERPDLLRELAVRHQARDTTTRGTALAELAEMGPRASQDLPGREVPEEHWMYRIAKKYWFFGFGAYS